MSPAKAKSDSTPVSTVRSSYLVASSMPSAVYAWPSIAEKTRKSDESTPNDSASGLSLRGLKSQYIAVHASICLLYTSPSPRDS